MPDDMTVNAEFYLGGPEQDVEKVKVTIPGDKLSVWDRKVKDEDKLRWPDSYKLFKEGVVDKAAGGTPLAALASPDTGLNPPMNLNRINALNALHIYTVEQLAGVQDGLIPKLGMGAREENRKVKEWLKERETGPSYADLKKEVEELRALVEGMTSPKKRKEAA